MKIELIKEWSVVSQQFFYHIRQDGSTVQVFAQQEEAEKFFDLLLKSKQNPIEPEVLKSVEI